MTGYYLEGGYNLYADKNTNDELILFTDTKTIILMMKWQKVLNQTLLYNRTEKTIGITYKVASGASIKCRLSVY